ncbi:hypothetical protein [Klenkia brasiliensis]|uniref:hypothetical protein n=1 Tax=Klenkia brasiliensis TaxID=333142 RepID=UPI000B86C589|nr:hypothetical protein [Klenkia brasiliensis]
MGAVDPDQLRIYCNDHLAASAGGIGLVRRMLAHHRDDEWTAPLRGLHAELQEERAALRTTMAALGLPASRVKQLVVAVAEKVSRLKPDGRLGRGPLSTVVEFEFLSGAVLLKRAGFETLLGLSEVDRRIDAGEMERLVDQADRQHRWLADARREHAAATFGGRPERQDDASDT